MDRLFYNPACSKCRTAQGLLADAGIDAAEVRYLEGGLTVASLRTLMTQLGIDSPRGMMRPGEPVWAELGLDDADDDGLLEAIVDHPILLERPIFVRGDRAVIGRPPERVLQLLASS